MLDLVSGSNRLDVQKYDFLQVCIGRDEQPDFFSNAIRDGVDDFWEQFQKPCGISLDQQSVLAGIEQLLTLNGWVAALCPTLPCPFGQSDTRTTSSRPPPPPRARRMLGTAPPVPGLLLRVRHARRRPHADMLHRPALPRGHAGREPQHNRRHAPDALYPDSSRVYFCRDLWLSAAHEGVRAVEECAGAVSKAAAGGGERRLGFNLGCEEAIEEAAEEGEEANREEEDEQASRAEEDKQAKCVENERGRRADENGHAQSQRPQGDSDVNMGSDFDAMPDTGEDETDDAAAGEDDALADVYSIPNGVFRAAWILLNPQCVSTYADVSHAQFALDLFGPDKDEEDGPGLHMSWTTGRARPRASSARSSGIPEAGRHPKCRGDVNAELDHSESEAEDGS
ncbi:hypothetical protein DFH11DRAFT_1798593 [Phellopilus nigrolimitatus]|nr:hypothetical protein DFH11DRAFT_1798593 [Phellopilus nigrolimitatus]